MQFLYILGLLHSFLHSFCPDSVNTLPKFISKISSKLKFRANSSFTQIDGCANIDFHIKTIQLQDFRKDVKLRIDASVKEDGTGVTVNNTALTSQFEMHVFKFKIEAPKACKPGFPLDVKVCFTFPYYYSLLWFQKQL